MHTVRTKEELARALVLHSPVIYVEDKRLASALMTKDRSFRFVQRMAAGYGYAIHIVRCLGEFAVTLYKK